LYKTDHHYCTLNARNFLISSMQLVS